MADPKDKKPVAKPVAQTNAKTTEQIISLLAGLFLLSAIATGLLSYLGNFDATPLGAFWNRVSIFFLDRVWPVWKVAALVVSAGALIGIVYSFKKLQQITNEELKVYGPPIGKLPDVDESKLIPPKNERWEKVQKYINSNNSSDWRLAVIEADVMLEELLRTLGYVGESVGEMLKSIDKSEFLTVDDAWEAHKVRNNVAHSGGDFQLSERDARHTISLFEKVFREFQVI